MNFAVIGSFWLTENMISAMDQTPGIRYTAHYSRSLEKAKLFTEKLGKQVKLFDNLDDLASDPDINAVYIASPNATHYAIAKKMLLAGKHVLCEKPACVHPEENLDLCEISNNQKKIYLEATMNVHMPWAQQMKEQMKSLGPVVNARIDFCQRSSKIDAVRRGESFSTFDKSSAGGVLMDLGVYSLYLCLWLFGIPKSVQSFAEFFETGVDITDTVILSYENFRVVLTMSKLAESRIRSEIICESGSVTIGTVSQVQNVSLWDVKGNQTLIHGTNDFPYAMKYELADFLAYANGDKADEYAAMHKLSMDVANVMAEIRAQIGYTI